VSALVEAVDLHKKYQKGSAEVAALRGVSFAIAAGEFVALVGRSGSGKSTLLNIIGGLDTPSSGTLRVGGSDLAAMDRELLARHRRSTVGMIFQSFNLIPSRTALENVALPMIFAGLERSVRSRRAAELLDLVGLERRHTHKPAELSGGEAQRVAIARALAAEPDILVCDEITSALDVSIQGSITELLNRIKNERSISMLFVTHDLALVRSIADRVLVLQHGRLVEGGLAADVLDRPEQTYTQDLLAHTPTLEHTLE
jgi:ABC-type methionine transport system ATPase subunit